MMHLKRLSKSGLTALSVSVFYHTAVLLLLTHCCGAQLQVVGPLQPVIVTLGEDIILPCRLEPAVDAAGMTFEWARPDLNPRFVHVWHEHQNLHVNQHPSYKGRTSVSVNQLKQGDVSLKLSKVKLSDSGTYRCYFPDLDKDSTAQLVVGTASQAVISLAGIDKASRGVVLQCESAGWHPEPEVLWLDGEGKLLSAGPTETVRGPDDLYTVSSRVTVEKRHSNSFTCRVQQRNINQTTETHIQVPDDLFVAPCSSAACISISLVACFICVAAVGFAAWKWRQNKIKTSPGEAQRLMAEEEHKNMVDALMKQMEGLKEQRDKLNSQKTKMEELVEDSETKLQSVERDLREKGEDKGFISSPGFIKLKEIISQNKQSLNDRLMELETLVLDTEKLLLMTEGVIVRTTEKKRESENHTDKT
ncbi:butyrophilin subfamily 3 member A2-like [Epinephelus fuscoguttatus]|uniref:butyrophilin subfamily 3 member A2-like n=1 Tax=Epinephelus fuscoguttatus TaxID=293821 RepID=UPI0020D0F56A|nr:butyrophilin subfamily 3 member A2-like [Epinephelus fuscoguttatus]